MMLELSGVVVALARAIAESSNLRFGGLQCYHGGIQHVRTTTERLVDCANQADWQYRSIFTKGSV